MTDETKYCDASEAKLALVPLCYLVLFVGGEWAGRKVFFTGDLATVTADAVRAGRWNNAERISIERPSQRHPVGWKGRIVGRPNIYSAILCENVAPGGGA